MQREHNDNSPRLEDEVGAADGADPSAEVA
jgi:hypothetical protein